MSSYPRLDQPSRHRRVARRRYPLSDCCGAPVLQGGICAHCRELCEEDEGDTRAWRAELRAGTREDGFLGPRFDAAEIRAGDGDSRSPFDEMVFRITTA